MVCIDEVANEISRIHGLKGCFFHGDTNFSAVYRVTAGRGPAILKIALDNCEATDQMENEIYFLTHLNELPGVMKLIKSGEINVNGKCSLPYEFFPYMKSLDAMLDKGGLAQELLLGYMHGFTHTLMEIHELNVGHNDLTTKNLYLNSNMVVGDWGCAAFFDGPARGYTPGYRHPKQAVQPKEYTTSDQDIWDVGIIFFQMLTNTTKCKYQANLKQHFSDTQEGVSYCEKRWAEQHKGELNFDSGTSHSFLNVMGYNSVADFKSKIRASVKDATDKFMEGSIETLRNLICPAYTDLTMLEVHNSFCELQKYC
jgi:serine/threonine protein kinase